MSTQITTEEITRIATEAAIAAVHAVLAANTPIAPAVEARVEAAPKAPKADVRYRSEKAKANGREQAAQIWARHYAEAGVKKFADLTPAQQKAAKAEVAAAWKGIKGTRKTKA